jgi:hypothetical protein
MQNIAFSTIRNIPIENSKLSVLSKVLRFELALMSILCTSLEYYSSFYCFTKYFVDVSNKITVATLLSFQAVISNLKTQLHEENTRLKRSSQHSFIEKLYLSIRKTIFRSETFQPCPHSLTHHQIA